MNKEETTRTHIGKYVFIVSAIVFGSLIFSASKAYETPLEGRQFKAALPDSFQDTSSFKNLDSLEFKIRNSIDPSFGQTVSNDNALVLLDGKRISKKQMNSINPEHIKEICVYKGEMAVSLYGEKARDGVILITSKTAED